MQPDDAVDSSMHEPAPDGRAPVHLDADPWAPGGAMSRSWVTPPRQRPSGASGSDSRAHAEPRPGRQLVAAVVALAAATVGVAWWQAGDDSSRSANTSRVVAARAVNAVAGPSTDIAVSHPPPDQPVDTIIGTISWSRVDGDASSYPARITDGNDDMLVGGDESGQRWLSEDGITWAVGETAVRREVGGIAWFVDQVGARRTLQRELDGKRVEVPLDIAAAPQEGFELVPDIGADSHDGFPFALAGDVFVLSTVRAELPWAEITGRLPGDPFRITVSVDGVDIGAVSGDFHEMPVSRFVLRADDGGRYVVTDLSDEVVSSFATPDDGSWSAADIVAGVSRASWSRWDGRRFVALAAPWKEGDRVDVAATRDGFVARSRSAGDRRSEIWRTDDGRDWAPVALPDSPKDDTQVAMYQGDDEVIVTAITDAGAISWTTTDGVKFEQLDSFTGVEHRTRTSFGWLAEHPRSAPQIGVSPDGSTWELIDLRELLGLDDSYWDVTITARAIGSDIVVLVDRPAGRTLVIGTVQSSG